MAKLYIFYRKSCFGKNIFQPTMYYFLTKKIRIILNNVLNYRSLYPTLLRTSLHTSIRTVFSTLSRNRTFHQQIYYIVLLNKWNNRQKSIFHKFHWTLQDSLLPRDIVLLLFSINDFLAGAGDLPAWIFIRRSKAGT